MGQALFIRYATKQEPVPCSTQGLAFLRSKSACPLLTPVTPPITLPKLIPASPKIRLSPIPPYTHNVATKIDNHEC